MLSYAEALNLTWSYY